MDNKKISELTNYATPLDADLLPVVDTANATTKKVTWANVKAVLKTYFDTLYDKTIDVINAATGKTTPVDADTLPLSDSEAANVLKKVTWANVKATLKTYFDTLYGNVAGQASSVDNEVALFSGTGGKTIKRASTSGIAKLISGVLSVVTAPTGDIVGTTDAQALSNKTLIASNNVLEEITTVASSATPTPTGGSLRNFFTVTAQAEAGAFAAPSGSPANSNVLIIRIKDNGTARALSWDGIYRAIGVTLPTTTVLSKTLYLGCKYNSADSKWDVIAVGQEA